MGGWPHGRVRSSTSADLSFPTRWRYSSLASPVPLLPLSPNAKLARRLHRTALRIRLLMSELEMTRVELRGRLVKTGAVDARGGAIEAERPQAAALREDLAALESYCRIAESKTRGLATELEKEEV